MPCHACYPFVRWAHQGGHEEFLLVKEAYRVLSDPELKATYDRRRTVRNGHMCVCI